MFMRASFSFRLLRPLQFAALGVVLFLLLPSQSFPYVEHREKPAPSEKMEGQDGALESEGESRYKGWLDEVIYISTTEERQAFQRLKSNEERATFIEEFWERRNAEPGNQYNKFKEEYYRRLAYAKEHFHYLDPTLKDDRARVYVQFGPPDETYHTGHESPGRPNPKLRQLPVERWVYHFMDGIGKNVIVDFTDPSGSGEYRVVIDPATLADDTPSAGSS
jgi:GWxTD domain-containing protein